MENAIVKLNDLNFLVARAHVRCHMEHGRKICQPESFFHRVGRWILTGVLLFFGLIALMILCCCIKRRRSKRAKAANGYPVQAYEEPKNISPSSPQPPPPIPPPPPVDSRPGQMSNGFTSFHNNNNANNANNANNTPHRPPMNGKASSYYNGEYH